MKNLKINKGAIMMILTGAIVVAGAEVKQQVTQPKKAIEVTKDNSNNKNNKVKETPTKAPEKVKTPEPTATPTPTATPEPTPTEKITYYVNSKVNLKNDPEDKKSIKTINAYDKVNLIFKYKGYSLVKKGKDMGYIKTSAIRKFTGKYVEVNLTKQKVKVYDKKGKAVLKSNVVTGLATDPDRQTPIGKYTIYSKETNRDLVGKNPDGSEKYRSHVNYWMPFKGGYGLHDAKWRTYFGGNIYKTNGSHGCVNLPTDFAPKVYKKVDKGTTVLIHK